MRKEIEELLSSEITGYQIEKETGVRQSTISNIRLGKSKLDTLPFGQAEKLYKFYKENSNNQ